MSSAYPTNRHGRHDPLAYKTRESTLTPEDSAQIRLDNTLDALLAWAGAHERQDPAGPPAWEMFTGHVRFTAEANKSTVPDVVRAVATRAVASLDRRGYAGHVDAVRGRCARVFGVQVEVAPAYRVTVDLAKPAPKLRRDTEERLQDALKLLGALTALGEVNDGLDHPDQGVQEFVDRMRRTCANRATEARDELDAG